MKAQRRLHLLGWAGMVLLVLGLVRPAAGQGPPTAQWPEGCREEPLGQQIVLTCLPEEWNGIVVLYAHGYVPPQEPLQLPGEELDDYRLSDDQTLVEELLELGFAFATTSFSRNGYAVEAAGADLDALLDHFEEQVAAGAPRWVLVVGASEGGLVALQQLERSPERYHGGLALCAPVGGAPYQLDALYGFRALFDSYFPEVFPFGLLDLPAEAYLEWEEYAGRIRAALAARPERTAELFRVSGAAWDPLDRTRSAISSTLEMLHYSIWGTVDLIETAGGVPFGNLSPYRVYRGAEDDAALNARIERVAADAAAQAYVRRFYEPTGQLRRPLVTLHTTQDPVVPYRHELLYRLRAIRAGSGRWVTPLRVSRYGHCNFTRQEVLRAFALLVGQVTGAPLPEREE